MQSFKNIGIKLYEELRSQGTHCLYHSVLTICTQTGTCDTRSGDLVFFPAAFDEFSLLTKN